MKREGEAGYQKEAWKSLTTKQKLRQFRDYYLIYVVIVVVALIFVINIVKTIVTNNEKDIFAMAVVNDSCDETAKQDLIQLMKETLEITDPNETIMLRDGFSSEDPNQVMAFQVFVAAKTLDCVVADQESFAHYAANGMFYRLTDLFTEEELAKWSELIFETPGYIETDPGESYPEGEEPVGETAPYGFSMSQSVLWQKTAQWDAENAVIGVVSNAPDLENAKIIIKMLLESL